MIPFEGMISAIKKQGVLGLIFNSATSSELEQADTEYTVYDTVR